MTQPETSRHGRPQDPGIAPWSRRRIDDAWSFLGVVGDQVLVVHQPPGREESSALSGSDVDCAVVGLDPSWPLRLGGGWAVRQCIRYGLRNWYWVIEKDGQVIPIDTFEDPSGLEQDGFPTTLFASSQGTVVPPALRSAYLTAKRIRKGVLDETEWLRIGELAQADPAAYRGALEEVFGRLSGRVGHFGLDGRPPDSWTWRQAWLVQRLRRFRTPARVISALVLRVGWLHERLRHPTGLLVMIVGPDGCGKSSLASALPEVCHGFFRREAKFHWRPGLLPRPGAFLGRSPPDPAAPHSRATYGRSLSLLLLGYYWIDFVVGGWLRIWPVRIRSGLVVMERGWYDIAVDPRRYRLQVPNWLVRSVGRTLSRPDVTLVLDAPPSQLRERKAELPEDELSRQLESWRRVPPARLSTVRLDASQSRNEVVRAARREVLAALECRTISRLGSGWVGLPSAYAARSWIPRGPRGAALAALQIYQPTTARGRLGWEAARLVARFGGFRLLPRSSGPPAVVRQAVAEYVPRRGTLAITQVDHGGPYVVLVLDEDTVCRAVAKIVTSSEDEPMLAREAAALQSIAGLLPAPLSAPRLLAHEPRTLVFEAVPWTPRPRPWLLTEDVAFALGAFFRAGGQSDNSGATHGKCAPWNLFRTPTGWSLVDWERASTAGTPFADLCHFVVEAHIRLGRPSERAVVDGFVSGTGAVGRAVAAYANGAGRPLECAATFLRVYLESSESVSSGGTVDERAELAVRRRLLSLVGG